jgi:hypothetical protein
MGWLELTIFNTCPCFPQDGPKKPQIIVFSEMVKLAGNNQWFMGNKGVINPQK